MRAQTDLELTVGFESPRAQTALELAIRFGSVRAQTEFPALVRKVATRWHKEGRKTGRRKEEEQEEERNKMQPTNPNAHTYVHGTDVETHGYAVTQNTFLQ